MSFEPLWKRLRNFDWESAGIPLKEAKSVQKLLQDLAAKKEARAMKASQKLWAMMKAQSNLGPVIRPFLQEIKSISEPAVQKEIDDLLSLD